jgi:phage-related protein
MAGQLVTQFANFLMQNYPTILQAGADLLLNLVNGIVNNLPQIIASVVQVIASFVATIGQNLPTILAQGITIIGKLVAGLIQAIPAIIGAIPQIIQAIVNTFGQYDWASVGTNLIEGIKNGIVNAAGAIADAAKEAAQKAFEAAKDFLGIESPAKKGIYIGEMWDAGIAKGILGNSDMVEGAMNSLDTLTTAQITTVGGTIDSTSTELNNKMDVLLGMLSNYLPEIASNGNINVDDLYKGFNRQMGWAMQ